MAFAWACSMLTMRTSNLLPDGADVHVMSTAFLVFSFGVNILTMVLLAINEFRKPGSFEELPDWLFVSAAIIGILVLKSPTYGVVDGPTAFFLGCFMTGISYGYLWVAWARIYGRLHPDITTVALPLTFVVTVALYFLVGFLADVFNLPDFALMACLPAISWVLLIRCQSQDECREMVDHREGLSSAISDLSDLLVASALFSFLFGFIWESSLLHLLSVEAVHRVPLMFSAAMGVLLFLFTIFGRKRVDIDWVYKVAAPVIVASCALFPLLFAVNPLIIGSVMDCGFTVLEVLAWVMVATVSYDYRASGVIVGAIARSVFLLFRLAGFVVAYFMSELSVSFGLASSMFSAMAVGAVVVWGFIARKRPEESSDLSKAATGPLGEDNLAAEDGLAADDGGLVTGGTHEALAVTMIDAASKRVEAARETPKNVGVELEEPEVEADEGAEGEEETLESSYVWRLSELVSEHCGLSRREAELLPYLALGRSASFIANEFYISENTVRTHIKHILEKTGAPSKRAITDCVYTEGAKLLKKRAASKRK